MVEEEIVNKDCYYKDAPDNEFFNYSIHGLNIDGIKKYCLMPTNNKYLHMVQLNKDLKKVIETSKILQKERQKKYDINNVYDDERLIKMYSVKKEDNINSRNNRFNTLDNRYKYIKNNDISKSSKYIEERKTLEKPVEIKVEKDNKIVKEEENQSNLNKNPFFDYNSNNKTKPKYDKFGIRKISNSFKKYRYGTNLNTCYSLKGINKSKKKVKELDLPFIKPRKIIIEYQLANDCGVEKEDKNKGHNNYMGVSFNPFNYSINPKNRKARNVNGALFLH